jgi:hypothetical protein
LTRAIGAEPLSEVCLRYARASVRKIYWEGVAGGNVPLRWVAQDAGRPEPREETFSLHRC